MFHTGASRGQGTELAVLARQVGDLGTGGVRDLVARGYTDWDDALDHGELGARVIAVGPFWTADGHNEIDIVALAGRARTPILAGEAKWAGRSPRPDLSPICTARQRRYRAHRMTCASRSAPGNRSPTCPTT